jgi:hypothetical protein
VVPSGVCTLGCPSIEYVACGTLVGGRHIQYVLYRYRCRVANGLSYVCCRVIVCTRYGAGAGAGLVLVLADLFVLRCCRL